MLVGLNLWHEVRQTVPYLVAFLALLVLLVKRDRDAVRLMGYSLHPRYQKLQDSWHLLGYVAVAFVGVLLAASRHGLSLPAALLAGVLSVSWWIGFDVLLNDELDHAWWYVGHTARIDRATRHLAAWLSRRPWLGRRRWRLAPEVLMVTGKAIAFALVVAGYVLALRFY